MSDPIAGAAGAPERPGVVLTCTKRYNDIPFAHRQASHDGHCAHVHGHNWGVAVTFAARERDACGFVVDFGKLGNLREYLYLFDHALVLAEDDPHRLTFETLERAGLCRTVFVRDGSCEGLAQHFLEAFDGIVRERTEGRVRVSEVTVEEDRRNSATARLLALDFSPRS